LTYRCTSRCAACNIWKRPVSIDAELTWEQWRPVLENLKKNNIESVELFGGDALLRKDLLIKMIRFCNDNGIGTFFPTNSNGLTDETVQSLVDAGLGTIYFSLDEVPGMGGAVRGVEGHFERVTNGIALLKKIRKDSQTPTVSCITTVSGMNYRHLDKLLNAACEAGVDEYIIRGISEFPDKAVQMSEVNGIKPSPYFMPTDDKSHAFSEQDATELLEILLRIDKERSRYVPMHIDLTSLRKVNCINLMNLTYPHQACVFATTQVVISPYGNVLPCLYYKNYHLGNLTKQDLSQIWGNKEHKFFCKQQQQGKISLCDYCSIKYYHMPFLPTLRDMTHAAVRKAEKLVNAMKNK
jgi:radical SAM protein with 4Fe4S-binding SPASM domain